MGTTTKTKMTILFLDEEKNFDDLLKSSLETLFAQYFMKLNVLFGNGLSLNEIQQLTEDDTVNVIVIGNNMGEGISKAKTINEKMKGKTIITWNIFPGENQYKYERIGFLLFCARNNLFSKISELFKKELFQN